MNAHFIEPFRHIAIADHFGDNTLVAYVTSG